MSPWWYSSLQGSQLRNQIKLWEGESPPQDDLHHLHRYPPRHTPTAGSLPLQDRQGLLPVNRLLNTIGAGGKLRRHQLRHLPDSVIPPQSEDVRHHGDCQQYRPLPAAHLQGEVLGPSI